MTTQQTTQQGLVTWTRLRDGSWGIRGPADQVQPHLDVIVTRRDGTRSRVLVGRVLYAYRGTAVATVATTLPLDDQPRPRSTVAASTPAADRPQQPSTPAASTPTESRPQQQQQHSEWRWAPKPGCGPVCDACGHQRWMCDELDCTCEECGGIMG